MFGIKSVTRQDLEAVAGGVRVVICEKAVVAGVDSVEVLLELEKLMHRPLHLVNKIQAILLAGGSRFWIGRSYRCL